MLVVSCLVIVTPVCAQTAPGPPTASSEADLRAYLAEVQEMAENAHGRPPTSAEMSYAFTCLDRRYVFSITARYVGEKADHRVDLDRITSEWGHVSDRDRRAIADELGQYTNVNSVSFQCFNNGSYAYLVSGYGRRAEGPPSPSRTRLIRFDRGRLTGIDE